MRSAALSSRRATGGSAAAGSANVAAIAPAGAASPAGDAPPGAGPGRRALVVEALAVELQQGRRALVDGEQEAGQRELAVGAELVARDGHDAQRAVRPVELGVASAGAGVAQEARQQVEVHAVLARLERQGVVRLDQGAETVVRRVGQAREPAHEVHVLVVPQGVDERGQQAVLVAEVVDDQRLGLARLGGDAPQGEPGEAVTLEHAQRGVEDGPGRRAQLAQGVAGGRRRFPAGEGARGGRCRRLAARRWLTRRASGRAPVRMSLSCGRPRPPRLTRCGVTISFSRELTGHPNVTALGRGWRKRHGGAHGKRAHHRACTAIADRGQHVR
jgi:hypothetical protein